jgi:hypothetical protein
MISACHPVPSGPSVTGFQHLIQLPFSFRRRPVAGTCEAERLSRSATPSTWRQRAFVYTLSTFQLIFYRISRCFIAMPFVRSGYVEILNIILGIFLV